MARGPVRHHAVGPGGFPGQEAGLLVSGERSACCLVVFCNVNTHNSSRVSLVHASRREGGVPQLARGTYHAPSLPRYLTYTHGERCCHAVHVVPNNTSRTFSEGGEGASCCSQARHAPWTRCCIALLGSIAINAARRWCEETPEPGASPRSTRWWSAVKCASRGLARRRWQTGFCRYDSYPTPPSKPLGMLKGNLYPGPHAYDGHGCHAEPYMHHMRLFQSCNPALKRLGWIF